MDATGSAVGIASLGIQVCHGLLTYYDGWKGYNSDISSTYDSIDDLSQTLILLKASLDVEGLDKEKKDRVERCLHSCEGSLVKLSQRSEKLRKHGQPEGVLQKAWTELQRAWYPFRASTLAKLQEIVVDVRERLKLAVQVLQLDVSTTSQRILKSVAADTSNIADRTVGVLTSVAHISAQNQQILDLQQSDQFKKIKAWLSPPDPWTNHVAARQRHEHHTGTWFLRSDQYRRWKTGSSNHLWLHGKAGCGKTVLCSTAIEDIQEYCNTAINSGHAVFYFSFSDNKKQSYENLLRSLIVQLGWKEPGLSMIVQAYEKSDQSLPRLDDLEKILFSSIESFEKVFIILDALDECPEAEEVRQTILEGLERLSQGAPKLSLLATSREVSDMRDCMKTLTADTISIGTQPVDADIQKWLSSQLSRDRKLRRLDLTTKALIEESILRKADGMFRWAYCQVYELKKLRSTKPKYVEHALRYLPATLDATYERMLTSIEDVYRDEALTLLRWLMFSQRPLTLGELAEAAIINPSGNGTVDFQNKGELEDVLEILSTLVVSVPSKCDVRKGSGEPNLEDSNFGDNVTDGAHPYYHLGNDTKIRLAHYSVMEYLESDRILQSNAKEFYLESAREHRFLAHSCLTYITHYSGSSDKRSTEQDLAAFPLLKYAATSWFYHSSLQRPTEISREVSFLCSESLKQDWLQVYQPDRRTLPFKGLERIGSGLYYACVTGLAVVARVILSSGADVNAQGGYYGNALQAASKYGHKELAEMLLSFGTNANALGGHYGTALQAASAEGHLTIANLLVARGADVNVQGGEYGNALQAASAGGHMNLVKFLVDMGADISAKGGRYITALQAALWSNNKMVAKLLIDYNCAIDVPGNHWGVLTVTSLRRREDLVQILIDRGADINRDVGVWGSALQVASLGGQYKIVETLIRNGANVNKQGGIHGPALTSAAWLGRENIAQILINSGADVNAQGGPHGNALHVASRCGREKLVEMLIDAGADVNAQGGECGNALEAASRTGYEKVVEMLIERGANVNAQGGAYGNALQAALSQGHEKVVEILIAKGAHEEHTAQTHSMKAP